MQTVTSKVGAFVRSLALLGLFAVALPWALVAAADARFGGPAPWSGMPSPSDWSLDSTVSALSDRLSETTIADIVVRVGLAVAWIAIVVLLITVVFEVAHMVRHAGLAMPTMRGLGMTQRVARVIAIGLLVVVPMLSSPSRAVAQDSPLRAPNAREAAVAEYDGSVAPPDNAWIDARHDGEAAGRRGFAPSPVTGRSAAGFSATVSDPHRSSVESAGEQPTGSSASAAVPSSDYVVRAGDSVYSIAGRIAGPDQRAIADFADRLLELNLGRQMPDGQWFNNAAYIDVGWVLQLPDRPPAAVPDRAGGTQRVAVVEHGDSLWSIAESRLGEGERWREIYELNEGRRFDDGRALTDPGLIQPGWRLDLPADGAVPSDDPAVEEVARPAPQPKPAAERAPESTPIASSADSQATADSRDEPAKPHNTWITDSAVPAAHELGDDVAAQVVRPSGATDDAAAADLRDAAVVPTQAEPEPGTSDLPSASRVDQNTSTPGADARVDQNTSTPGADARSDQNTSTPGVDARSDDGTGVQLLTFERAAMLSAGVLALLAVRRRTRMRRARPNSRLPEPAPNAVSTERALRSIDAGDRFARVDIAIRSAAMALVEQGARVEAVAIDADGELELFASASVELTPPWQPQPVSGPTSWRLPASTPIEMLVDDARRVGAPCPTLVQLGRDDSGRDIYVDLEAIEALEIGGPGDQADSIVCAVAATLSASVLAEVTTLIGVGVADDAFLGHRLHRPARDMQRAFETAAEAVGSTAAADRSTFELRSRVTSGEAWEPAVVLAGSAVGTVTPPRVRTGLAVVSASPIHGPSSRLAPDGDAWRLLPLGLRVSPIGLSDREVAAIASLTSVPEPVPLPEPPRTASSDGGASGTVEPGDPDVTLIGTVESRTDSRAATAEPDTAADDVVPTETTDEASEPGGSMAAVDAGGEPDVTRGSQIEPLPHALVVRLLGPVSIVAADGRSVEFERSKTKELIAWLATHRERATRSNARAALWELDVRDATFANVVSEARRSLARLVEPPEGEEWVGRTMTDALPLHPLVVTDLDLIEHALDAARLQPPNLAIETLTPAVDWVAGVPFEGTSYLWPDAEGITSDLVLRAITVTNALAAHCLSVGDIDGVFAATGRGLQVLPAHEDMIAVRMRAYAHVGDRAGVRHEWETYERAIVTDPWSDGEPSDRMLDLRRELLSS